jgi:hypothetical protein
VDKEEFAQIQAEGASIFEAISDNMAKGFDSYEVQQQIIKWERWLNNFGTYSGEAIMELGKAYSQHPRFIKVFSEINENLPNFLTKAVDYYYNNSNN